MVATIIQTARAGWYYRVLETGEVQAGDMLERVEVGEQDWSIARTFTALIAGIATRDELEALAAMERLTPRLRDKARAKLG
jgi:MOSC domain-containing protein YiiM